MRIRTYLRYTHPTNVIDKCREASVKRHKKYDMLKRYFAQFDADAVVING